MKSHIGFTGTQSGMSDPQRKVVADAMSYLNRRGFMTLHHGDCLGADMEAHKIAKNLMLATWGHPPDSAIKRAWCQFDYVESMKPYLERNHDIVDCCEVLIAAPQSPNEILRSGTWATVRYARKLSKPIVLVLPSGQSITARMPWI